MKKILFVCMLNAARSQAAEAFFNAWGKETGYTAESAGMLKKEHLNPYVVEILKKRGIDMSKQYSKKIDFEKFGEYEKIITFIPLPKEGLRDADKKKIELWPITDPLGRPLETVAEIVAQIEEKVEGLINELTKK